MEKIKTVRPQIATWWRTGSSGVEIEPVRVVAFTEATVTYLSTICGTDVEERSNRNSLYYRFFESREEAKDYLVGRAMIQIETAQRNIESARRWIEFLESK